MGAEIQDRISWVGPLLNGVFGFWNLPSHDCQGSGFKFNMEAAGFDADQSQHPIHWKLGTRYQTFVDDVPHCIRSCNTRNNLHLLSLGHIFPHWNLWN